MSHVQYNSNNLSAYINVTHVANLTKKPQRWQIRTSKVSLFQTVKGHQVWQTGDLELRSKVASRIQRHTVRLSFQIWLLFKFQICIESIVVKILHI